MKLIAHLLCLNLAVLLLNGGEAPEDRVRLVSHKRRSGVTYEWWLGESRVLTLPKWEPESGQEPPLSLTKAIAIARKDGENSENFAEQKLLGIALRAIPGSERAPPFNTVFFYQVTFSLSPFETRVCVVLMDGSVLTPTKAAKTQEDR